MSLHPPEELLIIRPNAYDLDNNLVVNQYGEAYYVGKKSLHIDFIPDADEDEGSQEEEAVDTLEQLAQLTNDPLEPTMTWSPFPSLNLIQV